MMQNAIILSINDLDFGGGQRTVVAEANELNLRGIPVHVVTTLAGAKMPLASLLHIPESQIHHVPFTSLTDFSAYRTLFRLIRSINPYAIVSNLFFTNTVMRLALLLFPKVHVVVREGNIHFHKSLFSKIMEAVLSLRTRAVIGNSQKVVTSIRTLAFFTKKVILYNGIDDTFFQLPDSRRAIREKLGISENAIVALIVASLTEKKGHLFAFEALSLPEEKNDCMLLVSGEGKEQASLESHAQRLGIKDRVIFLGGRTDIAALLSASDIFLFPSLWEGMPNALLEAMAAGASVIATDVGGVSEIVRNEENGYLVPPKDAHALSVKLSKLSQNPDLRKKLGKAARQSVSHLTWERHVTKLLEIV